MKILNLSDLEASEIKYEYRQYPDGQQDIIITKNYLQNTFVEIKSRMNSFLDIEKIICAKKSLDRLGVEVVGLFVPYLLGARSDRKFVDGGNSYLVDVIAPIINSLNFRYVYSLDVHSDVAAACINNFDSDSNYSLVSWMLNQLKDKSAFLNRTQIISPDAGAEKKIYALLKDLEYDGGLIVARKHREISTGKILSVDIDVYNAQESLIIIDDICDGGRTFIELAKVIRTKCKSHLYLCVTHGIFSNGFKELNQYFDGIFCTNSIKDIGDYEGNELIKTNCKQLKVI